MKKVSWLLAALMLLSVVLGCKAAPAPTAATTPTDAPAATVTDAPKAPEPEPAAEPEPEPVKEPEPEPKKEPAVYNSVEGFHSDSATEGIWQYYFSIDDGATVTDPCEDYHDYGTFGGWHPWEGDYKGVGFNHDAEGYLEFNTDCKGGIMGVLVFVAPATGHYVVTAQLWNPWNQALDKYVVKTEAGVLVEREMSDLVEQYGFLTPTDVELKEGDRLYFMCNSTGESWASAYSNVTIYYEPQDDSVYVIPEVVMPVKEVLGVDPDMNREAAWNAYRDFDRTSADGANTPWLYATTVAWGEFAINERYEEPDWDSDGKGDANEWYAADGTGMGVSFSYDEGYLELNTSDYGATVSALGFKAPDAGVYHFFGYVLNPWGQNMNLLRVYKDAEYFADFAAGEYKEKPNEFAFDAELNAGETIWVFVDSNGGWVSAAVALFVNADLPTPAVEEPAPETPVEPETPAEDVAAVDLQRDAKWAAYRDFDRTSADGANTPWVYAVATEPGKFEPMTVCVDRDWGATEWYTSEDNYVGIGVSYNDGYENGYLELNAEEVGGAFSALGFKVPKDGVYDFNGYVKNVWGQNLDQLLVYENGDASFTVDAHDYTTEPNAFRLTQELKEGDVIWFFGNTTGGWVSTALAVFVDELDAMPEPAAFEAPAVDLHRDAKWAAYRDFDRTAADGANTPWLYAITAEAGKFEPMLVCLDRDWGATEWYVAEDDYVGIGLSFNEAYEDAYLEMNTEGPEQRMACLGFKAPADGVYTFNGYLKNVWGQNMNALHTYRNAEPLNDGIDNLAQFTEAPFGFTLQIELAAGDILWFFVDSTDGWVSAAIAMFVDVA